MQTDILSRQFKGLSQNAVAKVQAPPWSAGTCYRFGTANLVTYDALYQSGNRFPHSKEAHKKKLKHDQKVRR